MIGAAAVVAAGYPSYIAHPITLLTPAPLLVALVLTAGYRVVAPVWAVVVVVLVGWTGLLFLATDGTFYGLVYTVAMYAPFAVLAVTIRRAQAVALAFAVATSFLVAVRMGVSWVRSGAVLLPWKVDEGNDMSARLNMTLPLVLLAWLAVPEVHRWTRRLLLGLVVSGVAAIVVAQQRAGMGVLAVLVVVGLARTSRIGLGGLAVGAGLVWVLAQTWVVAALERARFLRFRPSSASRPQIWEVAFGAAADSGWIGVGPGNVNEALRAVDDRHAHNGFVQATLEAGLPGALLYTALATYLLVLAVRLLWRGGQDTLWALSLLAYLGFSVVSSPLLRPDFSLVLVVVVMGARARLAERSHP